MLKKRVVVIVVFLIGLMLCNIGYAETDQEILFRSLPWGISITDATPILTEGGLDCTLAMPADTTRGPIATLMREEISYDCNTQKEVWFPMLGDIEVAGYKPEMIFMNYAYTVDDKNNPNIIMPE